MIGNGPSSYDYRPCGANRVFGCNLAFRDHTLTDCVMIDQQAIQEYGHCVPEDVNCWTRNHRGLSDRWHKQSSPGIDSGSFAIDIALKVTYGKIYCFGFDGVLAQDHSTRYNYKFRTKPPRPGTHKIHRMTVQNLYLNNPGRIIFVAHEPDKHMETVDVKTFFRNTNQSVS